MLNAWAHCGLAVRRATGYLFMGLSIALWGVSLAVAWPFRALYRLCDHIVKKCLDEV